MPAKRKQKRYRDMIVCLAITSAAGAALMMLVLICGAWYMLNTTGGRGGEIWVLTAVFLGSMLSSILNHDNITGVIPRLLLSSGAYVFLLILLSLFNTQTSGLPTLDVKSAVAVLSGSGLGLVTNLVKSNKSYINKSKRKRAIT